jgi:hypothetical protein
MIYLNTNNDVSFKETLNGHLGVDYANSILKKNVYLDINDH